jgi:hypothetical protein
VRCPTEFAPLIGPADRMALNGLYSLREGLQRFRRRVLRLPAQLRLRLAGVHHNRRPRDVQPLQARRNERHVRDDRGMPWSSRSADARDHCPISRLTVGGGFKL